MIGISTFHVKITAFLQFFTLKAYVSHFENGVKMPKLAALARFFAPQYYQIRTLQVTPLRQMHHLCDFLRTFI